MGARSTLLDELGNEFTWMMLDAAPDGVLLVDVSGTVAFANEQAGGILAAHPDALVGMSVEELLPQDVRRAHRAHRARYRAEPTVRRMGSGLDLRARRLDGTEFPVEVSLSPLQLGDESFTVTAIRDVTERVQAEEQLHRVLRTLDASDDGVFIFDGNSLRLSHVNDGAVRLVGYSRDELLEMTPLHFEADATEQQLRDVLDHLEADPANAVVRQTVLLSKAGIEVPVEQTFQSAPPSQDGSRWVIVLARDVSARLAAEEELRRSQDALREAEQVLAIADDRERIARDLHDTVIQRLFGAGLNLHTVMAGVSEPYRSRLQQTVEELDATIKELRMAIFSLQSSSTAPSGLRGRLLEVITEAGRSMGFEPRLQFEGPIETIDLAVFEHLLAVLREALSNVARHAGASNVRVAVAVGDDVELSITDDGVGVPEEVIGGHGLVNMADRADELGGGFAIENGPTGGSVLRWWVPVSVEESMQPATD